MLGVIELGRQTLLPAAFRRRMEKAATAASKKERPGDVYPTPERRQHGVIIEQSVTATDEEAARAGAKVRRVQSPIERYAQRGHISQRQAEAAMTLRGDWELGIVGVNGSGRTGGGGGIAGYCAAQLDAATRYRRAVQAIGQCASAIVLPIVIGLADGGEITAGTLAKQRGEDSRTVMGMLKLGLDMLADHYEQSASARLRSRSPYAGAHAAARR